MTSKEIRAGFLKFFEERGHRIVPSAPVIPYDDPTLLFTNAGMNQFKDVFLGTGRREYVRVADSQKCIRVSGKHNDLEEVGRDTYHHTFFEMLGNWSFGDYYKKEAIEWAWELLTRVWGLDKKRLYATVYEQDDEAEDLWKNVTDIDPAHVLRFGKKDNFWEMGETGPCGPCSEIHIDLTDDRSGGKLVNAGDPRVMEIWNLVFIQYNRDEKGELTSLPEKHVDTGMGFERVCAVLQGKNSNYDSDVFTPIIGHIANLVGKTYAGSLEGTHDVAMRVIADHVRMLAFSIADGGIPSNEGRGYVMRRILRRAARFGRTLDMHEPFLYKVVDVVVRSTGDQYPEIRQKQSLVERIIKGEEESFNQTLDRGLEIFDSVISSLGASKTFPGDEAFKLYDTFGFPLDMTEMMAKEIGLSVDERRFEERMQEQRERSHKERVVEAEGQRFLVFDGQDENQIKEFALARNTRDFDYNDIALETEIEFPLQSWSVEKPADKYPGVILRRTSFYYESGGQVSDTGSLKFKRGQDEKKVRVVNLEKDHLRTVHFLDDSLSYDELMDLTREHAPVVVEIDSPRRLNIMRNHTATHIVHEALRQVLGTHLHQQGSLVAPDHLRFDFNHFERITPDQLKKIEDIVNEKIADDIPVNALNDPKEWLTIDQAKAKYPNVKMFFGDKYGDRVRIVEIDPKFSVELCGGTHVKHTREIGLFKIISESSVASGIRRIVAVTGDGLRSYIEERIRKADELDQQIDKLMSEQADLERQLGPSATGGIVQRPSVGSIPVVPARITSEDVTNVDKELAIRERAVEEITKTTLDLKKEISKFRVKQASSDIDAVVSKAVEIDGFKVVSFRTEVSNGDELKSLGDALRSRITSGVGIIGAVVDEKVSLVCVVTDDLIKTKKLLAGKIVGELAKRVGGGGGGRAHLATAGGKDVGKLDEMLRQAPEIVKSMLSL